MKMADLQNPVKKSATQESLDRMERRRLQKASEARHEAKRLRLMIAYAMMAKEYDRRHNVVARRQAADDWRDLATEAESATAPEYLTWTGRTFPVRKTKGGSQ